MSPCFRQVVLSTVTMTVKNLRHLVCRRTIVENISIGFCNSNLEHTKFKIYLKVFGLWSPW